MLILKMISVLLGLVFILFGYFIYFREKYDLINGFEADFKMGRKNEGYAKHVGKVYLGIGIVILIIGIILIIFA